MSEFPQIIREVVRTGIARFDAQAFPFLSRRSEDAAEATECAADQGAYWPYRERLLDQEHGLRAGADLIDTAAGIGLDVEAFRRCVESDKYADEVAAQIQGGRDRGVGGTPTVLVGGRQVSWGADAVIDAARRTAQSRPVEISGRVLDSSGPVAGIAVTADRTTVYTSSDGSFAITLNVSGAYLLEASVNGCQIYYHRSTGATGSRDSATPIQVTDSAISDIRIEIPPGVCTWQIRGRLIGANDATIADLQVDAVGVNARRAGTSWTQPDGSFAVTVPVNGRYRLAFWDGCWVFGGEGDGVTTSWDDALWVRVAGDDVSDVVFRVPENPCG